MRLFEIVGNSPPSEGCTESTLCKVLDTRATLGAARARCVELARTKRGYISFEVDDGRGRVLFRVLPAAIGDFIEAAE